jgi:predicted nucleic acid-binding protein
MKPVFVDTSGIVALMWARDRWHRAAKIAWRGLLTKRTPLVTTDLVLAESVALARSRGGFDVSVKLGEALRKPPFEMLWSTADRIDAAWTLYKKYRDHELSLCDCVSFAVMLDRGATTAFAYDEDFENVGFLRAR